MTNSAHNTILSIENLRVYFANGEHVARAVDGVDLNIGSGETVCLVGESGCGKTVTSLSILRLISSHNVQIPEGKVIFKGNDLLTVDENHMQDVRGKEIAMIFQDPMTSLNPVFTVGYQIEEAIMVHEEVDQQEARQRTVSLLHDVGIPLPEQRMKDYPFQLSGGQCQRVMIAMALACNPSLLIADEPTTALDVTIQAQILKLFEEIQTQRKMSLLYISHDLGTVARIAHRVYIMYAGIIVEHADVRSIFHNPCHPYTQGLIASLPGMSKKGQRLYSIPGTVPEPTVKPRGCPFHPRCQYVEEQCTQSFPDMLSFSDTHQARCPVHYRNKNSQKETG